METCKISIVIQQLNGIKPKQFTFAYPPKEQKLELGKKIGPIRIAYETYGELNKKRNNAILITHALSGDAHAAGIYEKNGRIGWWDRLIGPGKGIDTNKFYVICSNILGGCKGSTGPSSINPKTGEEYALDFPTITIGDIVNSQKALIDKLKINKLFSVIGGSMGGMQVLQWMATYPEKIRSAIPIATTMKHTPQQIAFNEVGRQAIISDPNWNKGKYYGISFPAKGLTLARMIGHITYMSDNSMTKKFGRRIKSKKKIEKFSPEFEVEGYLQYRGDKFVRRFDANSYLYITKAMDYFNLVNGKALDKIFSGLKAKVLVISFKSDWLYPLYQSQEIVRACKLANVKTSYCEITSSYGHDAFLLELEEEGQIIRHFLNSVF